MEANGLGCMRIRVFVEDPAGLIAAVEECDAALHVMRQKVNALGQMVRRAIAIEITTRPRLEESDGTQD